MTGRRGRSAQAANADHQAVNTYTVQAGQEHIALGRIKAQTRVWQAPGYPGFFRVPGIFCINPNPIPEFELKPKPNRVSCPLNPNPPGFQALQTQPRLGFRIFTRNPGSSTGTWYPSGLVWGFRLGGNLVIGFSRTPQNRY